MKKSIKQLLSAVLVIAMMATLLVVPAAAADGDLTGAIGDEWSFIKSDYAGGVTEYKGLVFSQAFGKNGDQHGMNFNSGTITIPVQGPCNIEVVPSYRWDLTIGRTTEKDSPNGENTTPYVFPYDGAAGTVTLTANDQSYIRSIAIRAAQAADEYTVTAPATALVTEGETIEVEVSANKNGEVYATTKDTALVTLGAITGGKLSITGVKPGEATVTLGVKDGKGSAEIKVTVMEVKADLRTEWNFNDGSLEAKTIQSGTETWAGMEVDATAGKLSSRGSTAWAQFNGGVKLNIPVRLPSKDHVVKLTVQGYSKGDVTVEGLSSKVAGSGEGNPMETLYAYTVAETGTANPDGTIDGVVTVEGNAANGYLGYIKVEYVRNKWDIKGDKALQKLLPNPAITSKDTWQDLEIDAAEGGTCSFKANGDWAAVGNGTTMTVNMPAPEESVAMVTVRSFSAGGLTVAGKGTTGQNTQPGDVIYDKDAGTTGKVVVTAAKADYIGYLEVVYVDAASVVPALVFDPKNVSLTLGGEAAEVATSYENVDDEPTVTSLTATVAEGGADMVTATADKDTGKITLTPGAKAGKTTVTVTAVLDGVTDPVTADLAVEVTDPNVTPTFWDFRETTYVDQTEYKGAKIANGKAHSSQGTYGMVISPVFEGGQLAEGGAANITIPVDGPATIVVYVGYTWDIAVGDAQMVDRYGSDGIMTGDNGKYVPKEFTYTGGKGEVVVTAVTGPTYIAAIEVKPIEGMTPNKAEVYDFGAAALNTGIFDNKLTAEVINGWYPGAAAGSTGNKLEKFPVTAGDLSMTSTGYLDFRSTNPALACQATNNVTKAEVEQGDDPYEPTRGKYDAVMFSGVTDAEFSVTLDNTKKGDKLTYAVGEGGKKAFDLTYTDPSGAVTVLPYTPSSKGGALLTTYAAADGAAVAMANFSKPGFARIYREPGVKVAVSGSLTAAGIPAGYKLVFTNDESGVTYAATVSGDSYTVEIDNYLAGAEYTLSVADAEGWIVADGEKLALELADRAVTHDVTLANVDRVLVSGKVSGLSEEDLANLVLVVTKPEDKVYLPKIEPAEDGSFSVLFEKGVEYGLAARNVNDYELAKDKLTFTADKTENIVFTPIATYAITMAPTPDTVDLSKATITFVNVADTDDAHPNGYTYTFTGDEGIKLRDGQYKVTVKGTSAAQKLTPDLVVSGADTDCPVPFNVDAYVPAGTHSYKAIKDDSYADAVMGTAFEGFQAHTGGHGPYGAANSTLTLNMEKAGKVVIEACRYGQGNDLTLPEGATVEVSTVAEGDETANVYTISGVAAGKQTITFGSAVYLHSLTVQYESPLVTEDQTLAVGKDKAYKTVNEALKAVEAMNRAAGVRATIVIDPGDYEEQVIVSVPNVTLKNASATPSLDLKNKGVDIDDNAVRITWYYGHGYDYYSMTTGGVYDADVLAVNKANGYQSYNNGGGNQGQTFWNSTLSILADGFRAEGIIFENSFNQYQSKKAVEDVIVPQAGQAKEGAVPRAQLKAGDTAVQDRKYVERAAAVGVANGAGKAYFENCKVIGRQDALFGGTGVKMAFYKGAIYGGTDYIMGPMTAAFVQTDLVLNTSEDVNDVAHITAPQQGAGVRGYLFWNCHITSTEPGVDTASTLRAKPSDLGRPWDKNGEAVFYETNVDATDPAYYGSDAYKGATGAMATSILMADGYVNGLGGFGTMTRMGEMNNNEYYVGAYNEAGRKAAGFGKIWTEAKTADGQAFDYATWLGDWNPYEGKTITLNKQVAKAFDANVLKDDLAEAIATAQGVLADAPEAKADGTTAATVDRGTKFVTETDKATLTAAIAAAQSVYDDSGATVDGVLDAVKTLGAAVKTFTDAVKTGTKAPDLTALQASLDAAAAAKTGVVTSSGPADKVTKDVPFASKDAFDALNAAVKAAQTVADSATASQKDVDDAKVALDAAVTAFNGAKDVGTKAADAASLKAAIEEAKAAKEDVVVNAGPADLVEAGTKFVTDQAVIDALDAAIAAAQTVADKAAATQAELDAAQKALAIAKADFEGFVQTGTLGGGADKTALTAALAAAEGVYAIGSDVKVMPAGTRASAVDKGQKFVTQDVYDALADAIEAAKAVLADPTATEEDIAQAVADLNAAKNALKVLTGTKGNGGTPTSGGTGRPNDTTSTDESGNTVKKTTDRDGTTITVTSPEGEVIAKVVLPATIPGVGFKFIDVPDDHWAAKSINDMAGLGMVKGVDDVNHIYDMKSDTTRGAVATILFRMSQGKAGLDITFADVPATAWYADAVAWAAKYGVVTGFDADTFAPNRAVTREQLALMLYRYAKLLGMTTSTSTDLSKFSDSAAINSWAAEAMNWAVASGVIKGKDNGKLDPTAAASRAEAACMIDRFIALAR